MLEITTVMNFDGVGERMVVRMYVTGGTKVVGTYWGAGGILFLNWVLVTPICPLSENSSSCTLITHTFF